MSIEEKIIKSLAKEVATTISKQSFLPSLAKSMARNRRIEADIILSMRDVCLLLDYEEKKIMEAISKGKFPQPKKFMGTKKQFLSNEIIELIYLVGDRGFDEIPVNYFATPYLERIRKDRDLENHIKSKQFGKLHKQ